MNIYERLCYYDQRNPNNCSEDVDQPPTDCSCDNCFYGRTELAEKIISLEEQVERLEWDNRDRL